MKENASSIVEPKKKRGREPVVLDVPQLERLLSSEEAAAYLGINVKTLRYWSVSNKIRRIKVGNLNRYRVSDIQAYLQANTIEAMK